MPPDSRAVVLLAAAVAVVVPVVLAVTWSRARGRWRLPIRAAGVLACRLTAVAAGAFWVNRQVEAVTTWSRLFGSAAEATARAHGRHDDGPLPVTAAKPDGGRVVTLTVAGPASKITPLSLSTACVDGGGHNTQTWHAMEAPAFDWLSTWLGQPDTTPTG